MATITIPSVTMPAGDLSAVLVAAVRAGHFPADGRYFLVRALHTTDGYPVATFGYYHLSDARDVADALHADDGGRRRYEVLTRDTLTLVYAIGGVRSES